MRKCENCIHSGKRVNDDNGDLTLYCGIYNCEVFDMLFSMCRLHQYKSGFNNEKNYVLYDDKYLGEGYFIINEVNNKIRKFIKIYITNLHGFPHYALRVYGVESRDSDENDYTNIEFVFRNEEDNETGLYEVFLELAKNINGKIYSIDEHYDGKNNICFSSEDNGVVRMIVSRDVWRGKQHPTDFIDINIGDNYTCNNYEVMNKFYNMLSEITSSKANSCDITKILKLN